MQIALSYREGYAHCDKNTRREKHYIPIEPITD